MNEELQTSKELYEHADIVKFHAKNAFLKKAFENRTEYALPMWLYQNKRDAGEYIDTWCPYRHDGAFVSIVKVKAEKSEYATSYLISGYEDMEYSSDYVENVYTYETDNVADFIHDWLDADMDEKLANLAKEIQDLTKETDCDNLTDDEETALWEKINPFLCSISDPDLSEILDWAKNFVPYNENKTRKIKVEWDTDEEKVDTLPSVVEIPDK